MKKEQGLVGPENHRAKLRAAKNHRAKLRAVARRVIFARVSACRMKIHVSGLTLFIILLFIHPPAHKIALWVTGFHPLAHHDQLSEPARMAWVRANVKSGKKEQGPRGPPALTAKLTTKNHRAKLRELARGLIPGEDPLS